MNNKKETPAQSIELDILSYYSYIKNNFKHLSADNAYLASIEISQDFKEQLFNRNISLPQENIEQNKQKINAQDIDLNTIYEAFQKIDYLKLNNNQKKNCNIAFFYFLHDSNKNNLYFDLTTIDNLFLQKTIYSTKTSQEFSIYLKNTPKLNFDKFLENFFNFVIKNQDYLENAKFLFPFFQDKSLQAKFLLKMPALLSSDKDLEFEVFKKSFFKADTQTRIDFLSNYIKADCQRDDFEEFFYQYFCDKLSQYYTEKINYNDKIYKWSSNNATIIFDKLNQLFFQNKKSLFFKLNQEKPHLLAQINEIFEDNNKIEHKTLFQSSFKLPNVWMIKSNHFLDKSKEFINLLVGLPLSEKEINSHLKIFETQICYGQDIVQTVNPVDSLSFLTEDKENKFMFLLLLLSKNINHYKDLNTQQKEIVLNCLTQIQGQKKLSSNQVDNYPFFVKIAIDFLQQLSIEDLNKVNELLKNNLHNQRCIFHNHFFELYEKCLIEQNITPSAEFSQNNSLPKKVNKI